MSSVKAPLLSLGASGALGKTIVASTWKGVKVMREYVTPTNPNTTAQQTQRGYFTTYVASWRLYFTDTEAREGWDRLAVASGNPSSGFNQFMKNVVKLAPTDPDASFGNAMVELAGQTVEIYMYNADDGANGDEAGNFEVWAGDSPTALLYNAAVAIAAGKITTGDLGDAGDVKYVKIRKGGYDRTGIYKCTLIA